jgi:hypothetical protein
MNWTAIVLAHLNASSASGKVATIRTIAAAKSLPDPAPAAIANITAELRGAIGFSGKYLVDQDTTKIPHSLLDLAVKKMVRDCSKAVSLPLTDDEKTDERTYEARLDKIRLGQWPVETADTPVAVAPVQTSVVVPVTKSRPRQFSRETAY